MLNSTRLLDHIKGELGFPHIQIEVTDDVIIERIQRFSLRSFSYYVPYVKKTNLNITVTSNKVPGRANEYYISDDEGLEILNVKKLYFPQSDLLIHGHPPIGPVSHIELRQWALDVEMSMATKMFSSWDYTWEFMHPNVVRISPAPNTSADLANITVEYETIQPDDFRGIPNDLQMIFLDYALADIMILIGRIRKKYADGNLRTPMGEIPLSAEILDEGKEKKRELTEKLETRNHPNIIVDFG